MHNEDQVKCTAERIEKGTERRLRSANQIPISIARQLWLWWLFSLATSQKNMHRKKLFVFSFYFVRAMIAIYCNVIFGAANMLMTSLAVKKYAKPFSWGIR